MLLRSRHHRLERALGVVSPAVLAASVAAYVERCGADELHARLARGLGALSAEERTQLAMWVGGIEVDRSLSLVEVQAILESAADPVPGAAAFLRENPRAAMVLGGDAVDTILEPFSGELAPRPVEPRRLPLSAAALVAAVVFIAVVPLVAQYAHQRSVLSGLTSPIAALVAPARPVARGRAATVRPAPHHVRPVHRVHPKHRRRPAVHRRRMRAAARRPVTRVARRVVRRPMRRIAFGGSAWKFAPSHNPYLRPRVRRAELASDRRVFGSPRFDARARFIVASYLHAVIAGKTRLALAHLGLPSTANPHNLLERAITSPNAQVAIVGSTQSAAADRVQAEIRNGHRSYFEVFKVQRDGPALRIADRYYIPVP